MKQIEVFDGNSLLSFPTKYPVKTPMTFFVGIDNAGKKLYLPLDNSILSKHILFLGGIGTGKTNAFFHVLTQLQKNLTENDVVIIFDTKGDFYREYYTSGDVVISNDEHATGSDGIDYWNIFNEIENDDRVEEAVVEIAKSLFRAKIEKTNQPFFPNAAKDIFSAVLTHFVRNPDEQPNNQKLRSFLDLSTSSDIRSMLQKYPEFKAMTSYIADDRSPQTQGVLSELQQLVREIFIGNFKKPGNLSMRQLVRAKQGRKIFIEYDLGIGNMLTPIYSLLIDLAIKEALSRQKSEGNVYIIADEFSLLPNLYHIDDAVNFGRSLGTKLMIGIQNVDQIFDAYGEYRARSILSGFLTTVCFRVGDQHSKTFISELYGRNRKKETFLSTVQNRGIVENVRDAYVVEDWDISTLGIGDAIIGLPGIMPFKFHFDEY